MAGTTNPPPAAPRAPPHAPHVPVFQARQRVRRTSRVGSPVRVMSTVTGPAAVSGRGMRTSLRTCRPISVWLAARLPSPCPAAPSSGHHTPVVARRGGGVYCSPRVTPHVRFVYLPAWCWCAWPCTASVGLHADSVMPFIRQVPVSACRSTTKRVWPPSSRSCCSTLTYNGQMPQAQRATLVAQLAEREAQRALVRVALAERQQTVALQAARASSPDHATAFAEDPTTSQLRMRARLLEHSISYLAGCIEDVDGGHR